MRSIDVGRPGDRVLYTKPDDSGDTYRGTVVGFTPNLRFYHVILDGYPGRHRLAAGTLQLLFESEAPLDVKKNMILDEIYRLAQEINQIQPRDLNLIHLRDALKAIRKVKDSRKD